MAERFCMSRGPRIGSEGVPICWLPEDHEGQHRGEESDGWAGVTWGDPRLALRQPTPTPTTAAVVARETEEN